MSEWKKYKLGEVCNFNPKEVLKKGAIAKKISMDKLVAFNREIKSFEFSSFTGGSKFRNGDTLMARITPCLENGKTAQVKFLDNDEIGFGSTEFIVVREKENISHNDYLYYLMLSPYIREKSIKSMVGSSGRQRVQQDVLENIELNLPPLEIQKKTAKILSDIDDKIEINNKINDNLEAQAQAIFKSWFVDFEPFGGIMPSDWEISTLGAISNITSGKRPSMKQTELTKDVNIPLVGAASIMGYTNTVLYNEKILVTGRVGTHGVIQRFNYPCWTSDNSLVIKSDFYELVYQILKTIDYKNMNRGSTQPLITQTDLKNVEIVLPTSLILTEFETLVTSLMNKQESNKVENQKLAQLRDTLLPKLMFGEIDVEKIKI